MCLFSQKEVRGDLEGLDPNKAVIRVYVTETRTMFQIAENKLNYSTPPVYDGRYIQIGFIIKIFCGQRYGLSTPVMDPILIIPIYVLIVSTNND